MFKPSARIIAHSCWDDDDSVFGMYTFELEFHRYVLAEFNTHRNINKNTSSSRAIPIDKRIELVKRQNVVPLHWGANQRGMQADKEIDDKIQAGVYWRQARLNAIQSAENLARLGVHKQVVNRLLEPFSSVKMVATAQAYVWNDFLRLRMHEDAQPEIRMLAEEIHKAMSLSIPLGLSLGDWHMPYYKSGVYRKGSGDSLEDAIYTSVSSCAQVSYRNTDMTLEKAKRIFNRLNISPYSKEPMHGSPCEHQGVLCHYTQNEKYPPLVYHGTFNQPYLQLRKLLERKPISEISKDFGE